MRHSRVSSRGFSLIEVMVVLGIIMIMGSVAVVSMKSGSKDRQIVATSFEIKGMLDLARSHAMANGTVVRVGFSFDRTSLSVLSMEYRLGGIPPESERTFRTDSANWSRLSKAKTWDGIILVSAQGDEVEIRPSMYRFKDRTGGSEKDYSYVLEFRPSGEVVYEDRKSEKKVVICLSKAQNAKEKKWISISSVTGLVRVLESEDDANEL